MDLAQVNLNSPESSDREGDTFEDAPDTVKIRPRDRSRSVSNASGRSLVDRPRSSSSSTRSLTDQHNPSSNLIEQMAESKLTDSLEEEKTPRVPYVEKFDIRDKRRFLGDEPSPRDITMADSDPSKSPLLTARRVATFDDVQLSEKDQTDSAEAVQAKDTRGRMNSLTQSNRTERSQSRASATGRDSMTPTPNLPATAWTQASKQVPAAMSRKFSSPFGWLSRKKSAPPGGSSPPAPMARRHTAAAGSINGKPDFMLSRLDEERAMEGRPSGKEMLKERFKMLRLREETGIDMDELSGPGAPAGGKGTSITEQGSRIGLGIQATEAGEGSKGVVTPAEVGTQSPPPAAPVRTHTRTNSVASSLNPNLAPSTVSGMETGPSAMQDAESSVDWDLWQSLVYEGPAAVAKTSAAEMNRAIASGIPSAIRGVVWQILTGSKNEELEGVYQELVARGTDKELAPSPNPTTVQSAPASANSLGSLSSNKDSIISTGSSIPSTTSTPPTTNGLASPTHSIVPQEAEPSSAKMEAAMAAERQKKAKEDLASLRKLEKIIRKDLGARSNYSKYAAAAGLQDGLFGVCKAYALFDEGVGYAQGMNFIVMPLLFNMPEEEAFCLLVKLMNRYRLRELFIQDMPGLHLHLYQFERLLEDVEPALCYHLHKRGVVPSLYATPWFLTLFAYRFPLQLVLRVYDLVLSEGLEGAILKFAIAIMQKNADALLAMQDMAALKTFLNERLFDVYIDSAPSASSILESGFFGNSGGSDRIVYRADELIQDACAVNITPEAIKQYTVDYETRARLEKAREAEFEALRGANASLAARIRVLEERAEKSDSDHVQVATEMIRHKMENEDLKTANEELKGEVEALKKIVSSQPDEVEARLKDEMERIMTRNSEVQNENRALEEQMTDMEKDLVEAKMQYAQINADYENMKQKWSDLRKALDG